MNMSSEIASLADSFSIKKGESSPPDTYKAPSSASSIWVLTIDASHWVDPFFGTVTLPIVAKPGIE